MSFVGSHDVRAIYRKYGAPTTKRWFWKLQVYSTCTCQEPAMPGLRTSVSVHLSNPVLSCSLASHVPNAEIPEAFRHQSSLAAQCTALESYAKRLTKKGHRIRTCQGSLALAEPFPMAGGGPPHGASKLRGRRLTQGDAQIHTGEAIDLCAARSCIETPN